MMHPTRHSVSKRINIFKRRIPGDRNHKAKTATHTIPYGVNEVMSKLGDKPVCYLTGEKPVWSGTNLKIGNTISEIVK